MLGFGERERERERERKRERGAVAESREPRAESEMPRASAAYFTRSIFAFGRSSRPARPSAFPSTSTTSAATPNRPPSSAAPTP
jgi:hypothetical protein